jgi:16S rRNA (guanine(527)-N(7))-methyltransferase RsmG
LRVGELTSDSTGDSTGDPPGESTTDSEDLVRRALMLGVTIGSAEAEDLIEFERLLADPGAKRGLISRADVPRLRERHILDSLRAAAIPSLTTQTAYDIGSGGGLPGIVVAIACPSLHVRLVEPRRNRAAFLQSAIEAIGLRNAEVVRRRIEELTDRVDLCFARAVGPLERSWELARHRLATGGALVYFAGSSFEPSDLKGLPGRGDWDIRPAPPIASGGPLVIIGRP